MRHYCGVREPSREDTPSGRRGILIRVALLVTGLAVGTATGVVPLGALVLGLVSSVFILAVTFDHPLALRLVDAQRRRRERASERPVLTGWKLLGAMAVPFVVLSPIPFS